jgi:hypothetical protein
LTVENPKLAVADQKLSEAIEAFQRLKPFLFLILKRRSFKLSTPTPERAPGTQA